LEGLQEVRLRVVISGEMLFGFVEGWFPLEVGVQDFLTKLKYI
jgi:hypothetical protein